MDHMLFGALFQDMDSDSDGSMVSAPRRSTRSALTDVSSSLPLPVTPVMNVASLPTPSPSPDELIILLRGRRKVPVTWSPDVKRTPVKPPGSPNKSNIVLRSTPRKRLLLGDETSPEKTTTPRKVSRMLGRLDALTLNQQITPPKRKTPERLGTQVPQSAPLSSLLKGLSQEQLIELLLKTTQSHPELESEVREMLPVPDLRPVEDQLNLLKKNIFKCLPTSRLTSKFDSPAFNRASTHVNVFKKAVVDHGRQLVESENYGAVIEYVLMAWGYVRSTPTWENSIHNAAKRMCFKTLASYCMTSIKCGNFSHSEYQRIAEKLEPLVADSDDIQSCLKQITVKKCKLPSDKL